MNTLQQRNNLLDTNTKFLAFQPRNYSRQYNKSKSTKKSHLNKKILCPSTCEHPLTIADKLLKASLDKSLKKTSNIMNMSKDQKIEKPQQQKQKSFLYSSQIFNQKRQQNLSRSIEKCVNHLEKKGEYFLECQPNKKFCLKCALALSNNNNEDNNFLTKQSNFMLLLNLEYHKKCILDKFKQHLSCTKSQLNHYSQTLNSTIQLSQQRFSQHSAYITQSFNQLIKILEQKKRQLQNNLIISQQKLKQYFEENMKKIRKMNKTIDKYQLDIRKFYDQIINELPKEQFDQIMEEYEEKLNRNVKDKVKGMLLQDGVCVYIPNLEIKRVIEKANVEFYQPIADKLCQTFSNKEIKQKSPQPFYQDSSKPISNSLDTKIDHLKSNLPHFSKQTNKDPFVSNKTQISQNIQKNFLSHNLENKENINNQNLQHFNKNINNLPQKTIKNSYFTYKNSNHLNCMR